VDLHSGRRFTYREMNDRFDRLAGLACRRAPDQDGDCIALLAHNSTDLYELMFACRIRSKLMRESRNERLWNDRLWWREADIQQKPMACK
jgi:hypothetical protein